MARRFCCSSSCFSLVSLVSFIRPARIPDLPLPLVGMTNLFAKETTVPGSETFRVRELTSS
jgi:hypothetical protein